MAQYNLGAMYANGTGVPQDAVEAHAWINISTAQGNQLAKEAIEVMAEFMTREEFPARSSLRGNTGKPMCCRSETNPVAGRP